MNKKKTKRSVLGLVIVVIGLLVGITNPKMLQQFSDVFLSSDTQGQVSKDVDGANRDRSKQNEAHQNQSHQDSSKQKETSKKDARNGKRQKESEQSELQGPFEIKRVVDGDTVIVIKDSKEVKIRLLGINAPESVHEDERKNTEEGKEASKYLKELLESKKVYLEYDKEAQDQFGRDLAYLYLEDQSTMVNEMLISEGLAKVVKIEPNVKYFERLKAVEKNAKQNKKGFWGSGFYK